MTDKKQPRPLDVIAREDITAAPVDGKAPMVLELIDKKPPATVRDAVGPKRLNTVGMYTTLRLEQVKFEEMLCTASIYNPGPVIQECGWLDPANFSDPELGEFWAGIKASDGSIDESVGLAFKLGLFDRIGTGASEFTEFGYRQHAEEIAKLAFLRNFTAKWQSLGAAVLGRDVDAIRRQLDEANQVKLDTKETDRAVPDQIHADFMRRLRGAPVNIKSYVGAYDKLFGGFYPSEATIIAARPSVGKTALTLQIARNIALGMQKKRVLYVSLEMSRFGLWTRLACGKAGVDPFKVRTGDLSEKELELLDREGQELAKLLGDRLIIEENTFTLNAMQRSVMETKPDLMIVDQLSDIWWHDPSVPQFQWYGPAFLFLRNKIARQYDIPVVVIHQINRSVSERDDKRPTMDDLRGSGELEQRSDVVVGLYREDIYGGRLTTANQVDMEVIPLKNRQGSRSTSEHVTYDMARQYFE